MVDAHVHLEKGSYCIEWIQEFIQYALSRNINEIYFLEHTADCRDKRTPVPYSADSLRHN